MPYSVVLASSVVCIVSELSADIMAPRERADSAGYLLRNPSPYCVFVYWCSTPGPWVLELASGYFCV